MADNKMIPIIKASKLTLDTSSDSPCLVNYLWSDDSELEEDVRFNVEEVDCVSILCERCILNTDSIDIEYLINEGHLTKEEALKYTLDL